MQRAIRLSKRARGAVVAVVGAGCAVGAGAASCVTAQPPDVTQAPSLGPIIIQDAVQPPANAFLTMIPPDAQFIVPVRVFDPNQSVECEVFIDFDPGSNNTNGSPIGCVFEAGLEAGIAEAEFSVPPSFDLKACHTIQCFVANSFDSMSPHTPLNTRLGADSVVWQYTPNGPGGCDEFDAGDGAFPPTDTGLPLILDAVR